MNLEIPFKQLMAKDYKTKPKSVKDQQQSQSLNKTATALDALESININNATTRKSHIRKINSNLNKIEKEVEKLRKK